MGEKLQKMSWEGKNHDREKTTAKSTLGTDPVTREELAEVEANILKILEEISDKLTTKNSGDSK